MIPIQQTSDIESAGSQRDDVLDGCVHSYVRETTEILWDAIVDAETHRVRQIHNQSPLL